MNQNTINKRFEAALKVRDFELLDELMEEYAREVEKQKKEKIKNNPYARKNQS